MKKKKKKIHFHYEASLHWQSPDLAFVVWQNQLLSNLMASINLVRMNQCKYIICVDKVRSQVNMFIKKGSWLVACLFVISFAVCFMNSCTAQTSPPYLKITESIRADLATTSLTAWISQSEGWSTLKQLVQLSGRDRSMKSDTASQRHQGALTCLSPSNEKGCLVKPRGSSWLGKTLSLTNRWICLIAFQDVTGYS